jgi:hypothetical protein
MDINITPVNDPPTMATPAITVIAGRPARQDMWDLLSDIDTPRERLRLSTTSPYVTIRDFNITFMYPSDMGSGYDTVRLELSDGTDTTSVDLTVNVTAQKTTVKFTEKYAVYLYMAIPLAVVGTVAGLIAYRRYRYGWYEMKRAMVVNHDGRMLAHVGESAQGDDEMLVSSMLTAVQQFIEEAMKKEKAGSIKEFQYEDMKIAVERGARIYLAVFLKGYVTDVLRNDMKELVGMIEAKYEKELVDWDGMMTKTGFIIEAAEQLMNLSRKK